MADELMDIADDGRNDWMERRGEEDAGWQANGEHIQRSRLRVDARKWMLSKVLPKIYGEKQEIDHTSSDGSMTPKRVELVALKPNDDRADSSTGHQERVPALAARGGGGDVGDWDGDGVRAG